MISQDEFDWLGGESDGKQIPLRVLSYCFDNSVPTILRAAFESAAEQISTAHTGWSLTKGLEGNTDGICKDNWDFTHQAFEAA